MKALKILIIVLFLAPLSSRAQDVNLDMMPQKQRDSLLLVISERAIKFFGPDFYRDTTPKIERVTEANKKDYFIVTYPTRDDEKHMICGNAAKLYFFPENGKVDVVFLGDRMAGYECAGYDFLNNPPLGVYERAAKYPEEPLYVAPTVPLPDEALEETRQQNIQDRKEYEARLENWRKIKEEIDRRWKEVDEQLKEKYPDKDVRAGKVTQEVNRQIAAGKLPLAKQELDKRAKEDKEREERKLERQRQSEEFERQNRRE